MSAARAAWAAFNEKDQYPVEEWGWDTYQSRLNRYTVYDAYRRNTVYQSIETFAAKLKADRRLYRHIRGIYNPVARQNRLIRATVYPGAIDKQTLMDGALPIETDNRALIDALRILYGWSNLGRSLSLYVSYAALLGDCALWWADDRVRQKVRLEVLHPGKIRDAEFDGAGNVKAAVIEYQKVDPPEVETLRPGQVSSAEMVTQQSYTYTLKVDKQRFATFKDGEPFAYSVDASGAPVSEWDNEYGFVPLVIGHYEDSGLLWGENSFFNTQRKIDEINDAASLLNDSIRKVVIPLLKAKGIKKPKATNTDEPGLSFSQNDKDELLVAYLSDKDSDLEPIIIPLDISAAAQNVDRMLLELERDMPELALQRIREQAGNMTAPGVRTGYSDAIWRIEAARQNLDPALISALQMGITISAINGYTGFGAFNADSYARGDIDFDIKKRPIIADTIDKGTKITTLLNMSDKPPGIQRLVLQELEYSKPEIEGIVAETQAQQEAQARAAVRGMVDSLFGATTHDTTNSTPTNPPPAPQPVSA